MSHFSQQGGWHCGHITQYKCDRVQAHDKLYRSVSAHARLIDILIPLTLAPDLQFHDSITSFLF